MKLHFTLCFLILLCKTVVSQENCIDSSLYSNPENYDTVKIVFFIPLDLDKSIQDNKLSTKEYDQYTKYNYNLYQGVLIALDEIESENQDMPYLDVYIVDSKSDSVGLDFWLDRGFDDIDIIFSALTSENQDITKKLQGKDIPLIAMTSLSVQNENYPYYVQVQPSLSTHCKGLVEHCLKEEDAPEAHIITIYSDADVSQRAISYAGLDTAHSIKYIPGATRASLRYYLDSNKTNIIYATLLNPQKAQDLLEELQKIEYFNLKVYGMPTWSSIHLDDITSDRLEVVFSTGFYKHSDTKGSHFIESYSKRYDNEPNTFSFKSYESTKYILNHFLKPNQNLYYSIYMDQGPKPINEYNFVPICSEEGTTQYWENKNLYFIVGSQGVFERE